MVFPVEVILQLLFGLLSSISLGHVHTELGILGCLFAIYLRLVCVSLHLGLLLLLVDVVLLSLKAHISVD